MNIALQIVQILLAIMFITVGIIKLTQAKSKLVEKQPWTRDFSIKTVRFIGVCELIGAIGLILPQLTGIAPILTPLAAAGIGLIMILASNYHFKKSEYRPIGMTTVFFLLAIFVAIFKF